MENMNQNSTPQNEGLQDQNAMNLPGMENSETPTALTTPSQPITDDEGYTVIESNLPTIIKLEEGQTIEGLTYVGVYKYESETDPSKNWDEPMFLFTHPDMGQVLLPYWYQLKQAVEAYAEKTYKITRLPGRKGKNNAGKQVTFVQLNIAVK